MTKNNNAITTGVIWKQILIFFFPILIGAFFQQLYNTVDAAVVGQFAGTEALAAVGGSSGQILNFIFSFFMGLSTGATVIIAQHYGANELKKLDDALHTAYTFALVGGLALSAIGIAIAPAFLRLLRTPENLMTNSIYYVRILLAGLVFTLIYNIGSGILRAIGDSKRPLYILIVCCFINIILDIIFVMILKMGVIGAGIATDISQAISAGLVTWLMMKKTPGMNLSFKRLHITPLTLRKILTIGLPTALAGSMFTISNMIVQTAVNHMGVTHVAAWTAFIRIDALWWMINQAFSVAITTFVGQNFGAAKPDRIRKATREVLAMELTAAFAIGALILLGAPYLLRLFASDPEVIRIGVDISRMISPYYFTFAICEILSSTLRAENHVLVTTIINLVGVCLYRILWVTFVVPHGTIRTVALAYPISWALTSTFVLIYYLIKQPKILSKLHGMN